MADYPKLQIGQFTRTLTGSGIRLAPNPGTYAAVVLLFVPTGNTGAALTLGTSASSLLQSFPKNATYTLDFSALCPARIDLYDIFVNSTNNDVVHVTHFF